MVMNHKYWYLLVSFASALIMRCTVSPLAGGSDNPDFKVFGAVAHANGGPASNAQVRIIPAEYNPVTDAAFPAILTDTTDAEGKYFFSLPRKGTYTIQAVHITQRTRAVIIGIPVQRDSFFVSEAILTDPGAIRVMLPGNIDAVTGYIYVPGTTIFTRLNGRDSAVMLDSVPAAIMPVIYYASTNSPTQKIIRYNIPVVSGDTVTVANPAWKYAHRLYLNTSPAGADLAGNVYNFPVLVRLTSGNFNFAQAKANGDDIRFAKPDNTPLYYEIERWDAAQGQAEVWVKVDTVFGNDSTHFINMYWGDSSAPGISQSSAVFDTVNGFQGVWHLAEAGNTTAFDATGNHYDGTPSGTFAASAVSGAIGTCKAFDGVSSNFQMTGTAGSKLNFPQHGTYMVSAWVYADTLGSIYHKIVEKGDFQYGLQISYTNKWESVEYENSVGWESSVSPASIKAWHYLVGVRSGAQQRLYVDGVCADSAVTPQPNTSPRYENSDLMIGTVARSPNTSTVFTYFFKGNIDEVRISSGAPSAEWVKLCYMNQRVDDKLVVFK
jgi:hypothetical protein